MALVEYYQIQEDLAELISDGPSAGYTEKPKEVFIEAMEREATFDNMPFVNVRLVEGDSELRSIPDGYYITLLYEIDIISFDLTHFKKAAKIRDDLMGEVQLAIQQTPRFAESINASTLTPSIKFGAGTPEGAGGHVATGTFTLSVEISVEPA